MPPSSPSPHTSPSPGTPQSTSQKLASLETELDSLKCRLSAFEAEARSRAAQAKRTHTLRRYLTRLLRIVRRNPKPTQTLPDHAAEAIRPIGPAERRKAATVPTKYYPHIRKPKKAHDPSYAISFTSNQHSA